MDLKEIQTYIESNKDSEEVKSYIGGFVTSDRVDNFLNTEDGKKFIQPKLDSYHTKGLKTWQEKNLEGLVSAKVKELHPDADPRDIELNKMKTMMEQMQKEGARKELTNKALKTAQEKKLPSDLIDYFIGADEESTNKNIEKFIATMAAHDEEIKLEFAKSNSYIPPGGKAPLVGDEKMRAEIAKFMK